MFDEVIRILTNVRHVLDLKMNLIPLSILDAKRRICTGEGVLKFSTGTLVMKGQRSSN